MKNFNKRIAVITGGSSGIGRALAIQLAEQGCHLALCATSSEKLRETKRQCEAVSRAGARISMHKVDVADEEQVLHFRDEVTEAHGTDHIHLLFNNAGISGGGSFIKDPREQWEKTFDINWYGVYYSTRAFLPLLMASEEGHLVNTSSVIGLWAAGGAYATSKFVVRGFTESLMFDLRQHAPHVKASVVFPGKVRTNLIAESQKHLGYGNSAEMQAASQAFADSAPTTASEAASIILEGIRQERWRILVGVDAEQIDQLVRDDPEKTYDDDFVSRIEAWRE